MLEEGVPTLSIPEELINAWLAEGESEMIAFAPASASQDELAAIIAAFANSVGGVLLVGVEAGAKVVGVANPAACRVRLYDAARSVVPPLDERVSIAEGVAEGQQIVVVGIPDDCPDTYLAAGSYRTRGLGRSVLMTAQAVAEHVRLRGMLPFDRQPVAAATFQDLSEERLVSFIRARQGQPTARPDLAALSVRASLANLHVIGTDEGGVHPTVAGLLMFGHAPQALLPQATLQCARFSGTGVSRFLDRIEVGATIEQQIEQGVAFIERNIRHGTYIARVRHVDVDEYPLTAIREGLINALCHRDYYQSGTTVNLNIFSDRIEILNPGGLLPGLRSDQLEGQHRLRNYALGQLMYEAGLIERWGSGIRRMRLALEEAGLPPPQIEADRDWFRLTFTGPGDAFLGERTVAQTLALRAATPPVGPPLSPRQRRLLTLLATRGTITRQQYEQEFEVERSQAHRDLSELVERGLLRRAGIGRASYYGLVSSDANAAD